MKYQEEHLRFEIAYAGHHITISKDACFDFDSGVSWTVAQNSTGQSGQEPQVRPQCILEFERPDAKTEKLIRLLCSSSAIKYPVTIGLLIGEMIFESLEIDEKVRIGGEFRISQNFIR